MEINPSGIGAAHIAFLTTPGHVINFEERHVLPECPKTRVKRTFCEMWHAIHLRLPSESHLAKTALIPLGLRAQS